MIGMIKELAAEVARVDHGHCVGRASSRRQRDCEAQQTRLLAEYHGPRESVPTSPTRSPMGDKRANMPGRLERTEAWR